MPSTVSQTSSTTFADVLHSWYSHSPSPGAENLTINEKYK
jgi:hypothetical protein